MIGLVISDRFILSVSWENKTSVPKILNIDKISFNQSILNILTNESELNILLSSVLKKINQNIPFYDKKIFVTIIDDLVHHSVVENEIDISNDDMFSYINWIDDLKSSSENKLTVNFAQNYLPESINLHICTISKVFIRTLKLTIVEMGGNPTWMGPASTLCLDGVNSNDSSVIYRNGNKYFFLKVNKNRFDIGEITFSGGLPKLIYSTDPKSNSVLKSFGLEESDLKKLPVYCFQKLGRNAIKAWENADLRLEVPFKNLIIDDQKIEGIPYLEANIITKLINNKALESSFNFFETPGIKDYEWILNNENSDSLLEFDDLNNEDDFIFDENMKIDGHTKIDSDEDFYEIENSKENNTSSQGLLFSLLLIVGAFVFINYLKIQREMNSSTRDSIKGFSVEVIENSENAKMGKNLKDNFDELLMQSKSISSALLSLLTETEINRYNSLTITKSFLGLEYLSGTNPNIENILGISPSSFSVEALGKDSTTFLWYYSFDLPSLRGSHEEGKIAKNQLLKELHTKLSEKPKIKYFEKVYTKYQIYGPMLIWIKNKADILHASAIFSNMDDSILLRKFVLFNEPDRPNPRAGFYVSILED